MLDVVFKIKIITMLVDFYQCIQLRTSSYKYKVSILFVTCTTEIKNMYFIRIKEVDV